MLIFSVQNKILNVCSRWDKLVEMRKKNQLKNIVKK
jgi:hypothetical protein